MGNCETIKYFTERELEAFFTQLENTRKTASTDYARKIAIRNEAIFKIMYYCALRVTEATLIEPEFFNDLKKEIYCKRKKGGINNTLKIIDNDILRSLKRHINMNDPQHYLFENMHSGQPLSRKTLDKIMKTNCAAISKKIPKKDKWHCHTLRHTRAIILAEQGFDLKELQYWLGHSDVSNTQIYFEFTSKQHMAMYKKLK